MLRQTPSTLKALTRHYRAVLFNMRRHLRRAALATAVVPLGVVLTPASRACELCEELDSFVDVSSMFNLGSYYTGPAPATSPSASAEPLTQSATASGVFAGAAQADTRHGTQRGLMIYVHDLGTADIDTRIWSGTTTARQYVNNFADDQRRWVAANSGGKMDLKYDVIDGAIGLNPATGLKWSGPMQTADYLITQAGLNKSDYAYVQLVWDHMFSSQYVTSPGGGVAGAGTVGNGSGTRVFWGNDFSRHHELGHNLGFAHTGDYNSAGGGWGYDFATKQYVARTAGSPGRTSNLSPISIGVDLVEYGNPVDVMGNLTTFGHYNPRAKLAVGWLRESNFKNLVTLSASGAQTLPIYAHQGLQVVSRGEGANLEYGVAQGYGSGAYAGTFARRAQRFVANADKTGGDWQYYVQNVDLYCVRTDTGTGTATYGIEFRVDGVYIGVMQVGQIIQEKDIANFLYSVDSGKNLVTDLNAAAPDNPDRYRSTKYTLNFTGMATDATGPYANLNITPNIGVVAAGLRIDADSATAGAQNGSATWTAGAGNWRDIDKSLNNVMWTDGSRAVIGGGTGRSDTVTITGTVVAKGITFDNGNFGLHTLTGGTLALGDEGLVAVNDAIIRSALRYDAAQFWDVARDRTINVLGTVTTNANSLSLIGGGKVGFYAPNALSTNVSVYEGTITQHADQSPLSLSLGSAANYTVAGGSLILTAGKNITGSGLLNLSTTASSNAAPALWLGQGIASGSNPARSPIVSANVELTSGLQVIRASTGLVSYYDALGGGGSYPAYMYALISGDISGAGGLAYYGDHGTAELVLTGNNTFTGGIELRRGMLTPIGAGAIPHASRLTFNVASGDTARFYLRGVDRTISDLASTGAGTAIIANSTGGASELAGRATPDAATLHILQNNNGTYAGNITDTLNSTGAPGGYGPSGSAGALSLNKLGAATLTLSGNNTYTGSTTITAGTLRLGDGVTDGTLAAGSAITNHAVLAVNNVGARTLANTITGAGSLVKTGAGALTLSGANTYTGATAVQSGSLLVAGSLTSDITVSSGASLGGTGSTAGAVTFADGALYSATPGVFTASGGVTLVGALNVSFDTAPEVGTRTLFNYGTTLTGNLALASASGFRAAFTNDTTNKALLITLSNLAGVWNTTSGNWDAGVSANWANGSDGKFFNGDSVTFNDPAVASTVTLAGELRPASVTVNNANAYTFSGSGSIAGDSTLTKSGSGTLTLQTANTYTGATTVNAGTLVLGANGRLGTGGVYAGAIANDGALVIASAQNQTLSGIISGAGSLTKDGDGTLTLSGANTYSGGTSVNAGTLAVSTVANLGSGSIAVGGPGTLALNGSGTQTVSALISGTGSITKAGSSILVLTGANNTFSGTYTVTAGGLVMDSSGAENGAPNLVLNGGSFILSSPFVTNTATLGNLSGTGGDITTLYKSTTGIRTLGVNQTVDGVFAGTLTGEATGRRLGLVKSGAATLTLSGNSTYTGGTTVNAGTLIAGHNNAFGTGAVTVNSGGTLNTGLAETAWTIANAITVNSGGVLMGVGTHSGTVTINTGGALAPGNSPGLATFSGGLSFTSGAAYAWEFLGNNLAIAGTDFDQLVITGGTMSITSGALLKFTASGVDYTNAFWDTNRSFLIADAQGPGLITGTFTTDTSAAGAFAAEGAWSLNYAGGDVHAVWTAIPEPSTYSLLGAGALAFTALVRRRRKSA